MVLGITAIVVSLVDSLTGTVRKVSNERSSIWLWKKYSMVVLLNN